MTCGNTMTPRSQNGLGSPHVRAIAIMSYVEDSIPQETESRAIVESNLMYLLDNLDVGPILGGPSNSLYITLINKTPRDSTRHKTALPHAATSASAADLDAARPKQSHWHQGIPPRPNVESEFVLTPHAFRKHRTLSF